MEQREDTISPTTDTSDNEGNADASVIDSIYTTMSRVIEALNTDMLLLNKQLEKLRTDLEFACQTILDLKSEQQEIMCNYNTDIATINTQINTLLESRVDDIELTNEINNIKQSIKGLMSKISENPHDEKELMKQIFTTRSLMLSNLQKSTKKIYEDIAIIKKHLDQLDKTIKNKPKDINEQLVNRMNNMEAIMKIFFARYFGKSDTSLLSSIESRIKKMGGEPMDELYKDNQTNYMYAIYKTLLDIKSGISMIDKTFIE